MAAENVPDAEAIAVELERLDRREKDLSAVLAATAGRNERFPNVVTEQRLVQMRAEQAALRSRKLELQATLLPLQRPASP